MEATILGLDPANKCGWSLSCGQYGVWLLSEKDEHPGRRLERLRRNIYTLHREHQIEVIAAEDASLGSNNYHTAAAHNELRGVIKLVAAELELQLVMVNPTTLKKWLTGHGHAKKEHMIDAIRLRFNIIVKDDNQADAIAVMEYARNLTTQPKELQNELFSNTKRKKVRRNKGSKSGRDSGRLW